MKHMALAFLSVVAVALASPMAVNKSLAQGSKETETASIRVAKTSRADVQNICGDPADSQETANGEEWHYRYGETDSLAVSFDKAGVVKNYRYQTVKPQKEGKVHSLAGEKPGTVHCDLCPDYCTRTVCDLNGCRSEQYICGWHSCNCGGY